MWAGQASNLSFSTAMPGTRILIISLDLTRWADGFVSLILLLGCHQPRHAFDCRSRTLNHSEIVFEGKCDQVWC
jgi:hypothetical protein